MAEDYQGLTPPPELVERLLSQARNAIRDAGVARERLLIAAAYRAGADQELEACIDFVRRGPWCSEKLRAARRPKPPSLKEQALAALSRLNSGSLCANPVADKDTIRRALEQLPND